MRRHRQPKIVRLVAVGVAALLAAALFGYITVRDSGGTTDQAAPVALHTGTFVSKQGGFRVHVPDGMTVTRTGSAARFTSAARDVVVSVGPISGGPLAQATVRFLDTVRRSYPQVIWLGSHRDRVDGRRAVTTSGQVRARSGAGLRFVVVTVAAPKHNYALTTFAAHDSDPKTVLPRVDAIVNSFHVLR